ncbi:serine/threonine-protein kinase [Nocardiopsis sp. FR4]|uniref:serine/threonine-protein kinase n=1 Tax=Nocardiopsis sp. FR4 TaxID=2605985 RepID=UPI001357F54C|nr:serine/threonine-protein kinase [Nocardiopsis sp. FR4]
MSSPGRSSVGRYELRERLGVGGMGTVWRAWDPSLQRDVAVKEVLLPQGMSPEEHAEARERTLREARATARITNTAVVTVHDVLEHDGNPWIVMELLSGASLQHHLDHRGPLPVERVEEAARALLEGLRAAHAAGVTHRDVKPANIMLTDDDRTVLTDFGIANVDGSTALTQTGVYIGSPEYMAPERFEGERALPASDLWSLGVTLYALLEGRSPFKRDSITGIISAVLTAPVPPRLTLDEGPRGPESAPLRALIGALLSRDASTRPSPDEALALLARERRARDRGEPSGGGAHTPWSGTPSGPHGNSAPHGYGGPHRPSGPHQAPGLRPAAHGPGAAGPYAAPPGSSTAPGAGTGRYAAPSGHPTGRAPLPGRPGASGPQAGFAPAGHGGPVPVVIAAVMLGLNALYLLVLTAAYAGAALGDPGGQGWGPVFPLGLWGVFSAFAAAGVMTRSRLVYGAVILVQLLVSVMVLFSMFTVFIYTPEQLPVYVLMLAYNLVIVGLVLIPPKVRAFFGFGANFG